MLLIRNLGAPVAKLLADPVFDCFLDPVSDPHFRLPNGPLGPKSVKKGPQMATKSDPKATHMDMAGTLKNHGIYRSDELLALPEWSQKSIFVAACFLGAYFLRFLVFFSDFGVKMVPTGNREFPTLGHQNHTFLYRFSAMGSRVPNGGSRVPK